MRLRRLVRKTFLLATISSLMLATMSRSWAGDLQAEVDSMFNNLGAIGNYTAPGAFRGQTYNTYTGGSIFLRSPNKVYQLASIQFPYVKAGCGGIDVFGGSFSHLSAAERQRLQALAFERIAEPRPGFAASASMPRGSWPERLAAWMIRTVLAAMRQVMVPPR